MFEDNTAFYVKPRPSLQLSYMSVGWINAGCAAASQAFFFWYNSDKYLKTCICVTQFMYKAIWRASRENRPLGLWRCHTQRRWAGAPSILLWVWHSYKIPLCCLHRLYSVVCVIPREGFYGYDNDKHLKVCFLVTCIIWSDINKLISITPL